MRERSKKLDEQEAKARSQNPQRPQKNRIPKTPREQTNKKHNRSQHLRQFWRSIQERLRDNNKGSVENHVVLQYCWRGKWRRSFFALRLALPRISIGYRSPIETWRISTSSAILEKNTRRIEREERRLSRETCPLAIWLREGRSRSFFVVHLAPHRPKPREIEKPSFWCGSRDVFWLYQSFKSLMKLLYPTWFTHLLVLLPNSSSHLYLACYPLSLSLSHSLSLYTTIRYSGGRWKTV